MSPQPKGYNTSRLNVKLTAPAMGKAFESKKSNAFNNSQIIEEIKPLKRVPATPKTKSRIAFSDKIEISVEEIKNDKQMIE
jgi:hypothetical protein